MNLTKHRRATLAAAACLLGLTLPTAAFAGVSITGSVSSSSTNVPLERSTMQYGSASIDIDIGRYVRFGLNVGNEVSTTSGYQLPQSGATSAAAPTQSINCPSATSCVPVVNRTNIVERGAGLTIVLYGGDIFMPYIMFGAIVKTYTFDTQINGGSVDERRGQTPPEPNLGAGIGIRLNREFMLKATYQISQGAVQNPGDPKITAKWDVKQTVGITYQIN